MSDRTIDMETPQNSDASSQNRTSGSLDAVVRLQGYRVKLKNRRVYASVGPDQYVWMKWVKLEGKKREARSLRLTPEAAAATAAAIMDVLKDMMRDGTGKQPNVRMSHPASEI